MRKNAHDRGILNHLGSNLFGLGHQLCADVNAADLCLMFFGAEKFMDLLEKLSARSGVLVKHDRVQAMGRSFDRCGKSGRAGADDDQIITFHSSSSFFADTPYCVCTFMPSFSAVMQVRTLGTPSTTMTQSVQRPMEQKIPLGLCSLVV